MQEDGKVLFPCQHTQGHGPDLGLPGEKVPPPRHYRTGPPCPGKDETPKRTMQMTHPHHCNCNLLKTHYAHYTFLNSLLPVAADGRGKAQLTAPALLAQSCLRLP